MGKLGIGTGLNSVVFCAFMEQDQVLPGCFLVPLEASCPFVQMGLGGMMEDPKCCLPEPLVTFIKGAVELNR